MNQDYSKAFQWPPQSAEVRESLFQVFESGGWGKYDGGFCSELNERLAILLDLPLVRLCSSGTIAVEIALVAAGVKAGDEVVLGGYDFPGNFRAIENLDAIPVLADVNLNNWSLDAESFEKSISEKTRAVIVSHLHGGVADIDSIIRMAREQDILVIEDICQCPGATLNSRPLGSFGDICALSFGGSKLLSAGRGGAIGTRDEKLFQRAKIFCERGNDAFPLSELQAAVLLPQLENLNQMREKRQSGVNWLKKQVDDMATLNTIEIPCDASPDFYKVPLRLSDSSRKQEMIDELRGKGIVIDHGFAGFTNRSERRCRQPVSLVNSEMVSEGTLVLHHPSLLSEDFQEIVREILETIQGKS